MILLKLFTAAQKAAYALMNRRCEKHLFFFLYIHMYIFI